MAKYDSLNETLNTDYDKSVEIEVSPQPPIQKSQGDIDIEKDYKYTRGQLYSIIEKGQEAINGILELASESEMPRAYEVAGQLIKHVADVADKLIDLQKKMKDLDAEEKKGPNNVTNALFVGTSSELQKLLKQQKEINNTDTN